MDSLKGSVEGRLLTEPCSTLYKNPSGDKGLGFATAAIPAKTLFKSMLEAPSPFEFHNPQNWQSSLP